MAIGNWELVHEYFLKHSSMEQPERNKIKKQTKKVEEIRKYRMKETGTEKKSPYGLSHPNQNIIIIIKVL